MECSINERAQLYACHTVQHSAGQQLHVVETYADGYILVATDSVIQVIRSCIHAFIHVVDRAELPAASCSAA